MAALPEFPPFPVHAEGNTASRWKKWKDRFENLMVAMNITNKKRQKALLLHYAGEGVHDIFTTLTLDPAEHEDEYKQGITALDAYFIPKRNKEFDVYNFRQSKQKPGESVDTFHTRLRKLAETCEFTDTDAEIKSQIIQSCSSSRLRRRALRESEMTLKQLLLLARSLEISYAQASGIEKESDTAQSVQAVSSHGSRRRPGLHRGNSRDQGAHRGNSNEQGTQRGTGNSRRRGTQRKNAGEHKKTFYFCGNSYPHTGQCPAKGKCCNLCGKMNHFAKMCQSKSVKQIQVAPQAQESSSEDEYTFHVRKSEPNSKQPKAKLRISDTDI